MSLPARLAPSFGQAARHAAAAFPVSSLLHVKQGPARALAVLVVVLSFAGPGVHATRNARGQPQVLTQTAGHSEPYRRSAGAAVAGPGGGVVGHREGELLDSASRERVRREIVRLQRLLDGGATSSSTAASAYDGAAAEDSSILSRLAQKVRRFLRRGDPPPKVFADGSSDDKERRQSPDGQAYVILLPDNHQAVTWRENLPPGEQPHPAGATAQALRRSYLRDHDAETEQQREPKNFQEALKSFLTDLGGGTGASVSGTGNRLLDEALLRRMRSQDRAVMVLFALAYIGSLIFSASLAYRQAYNDSPVTYYADPRMYNIAIEEHSLEGFLQAFNQPPSDVQLTVTGLMPLPPVPEFVVGAAIEWLGAHYRVDFSFALDLGPWLTRAGSETQPQQRGSDQQADQPAGGQATGRRYVDPHLNEDSGEGVSEAQQRALENFLSTNRNDLARVDMLRSIEWSGWEELATNIKSKIRQAGFSGIVVVRHSQSDVLMVHKNRPWANFMHSRTTKILCALSIIGWFVYQPYMWLRHRALTVTCCYRVECPIGQYWPLIADKIGPHGFNSRMESNGRSGSRAPPPAATQ